jgi:hypothetical protein
MNHSIDLLETWLVLWQYLTLTAGYLYLTADDQGSKILDAAQDPLPWGR